MNKLLVTYDLNRPGQVYDVVYAEIKRLSFSYMKMQNTWFIKTTHSAPEVRDALKKVVDSNDKIFVCPTAGWAVYNMNDIAQFLLN